MIRLTDRANGQVLGVVQELDLEIIRRVLEEEGPEDTDYYINEETLELLIEQGLSIEAQAAIRKGLEGRGEFDLAWERVKP
jgi:hypothetical protein